MYRVDSIESPLRMNETGHWSEVRCVLSEVCADSEQVRAIST